MEVIRITKSFKFETAHALYGYDGKCKNIHGHSYKLFVTIKGSPITETSHIKEGMVIDFTDLKKIVNEEIVSKLDHAILLNENTPHKALGESLLKEGHMVVFTQFQPTCENMVLDMAYRIKKVLPLNLELVSLKLHETETSYSEWLASDNTK